MTDFGYGLGGYGTGIPFGSYVAGAPSTLREIGDFEFNVFALSEGYSIRIEFTVPETADAPTWIQRLRIIRKTDEWPQSWDDADATEVIDDYFFVSAYHYVDQTELVAGKTYYYALYTLRDDGTWVCDASTQRDSAYPYDRWGSSEYLFQSLPRGWRSADADIDGNPLESFMSIFGALIDDVKTDCEHLSTLFDIDEIHDDLIWLQDKRLGWPTWWAAGGIKRRGETESAVELYKILGRASAYEQVLEEISSWDATIVEGWKFVMWSNDADCITPDMTDPDTLGKMGWADDILKYTPDTDGWHTVNGLCFYLSEITDVSDGISQDMLSRFVELIEWSKASFVNTHLVVVPLDEEIWLNARIIEDWGDPVWAYNEATMGTPTEWYEDTTASWAIFTSTLATSTTTTIDDRTFHSALEYV